MGEGRKTLVFAGVAVLLVAVALLTAPRKFTPNAFLDQGESFFPDFTDPNAARALEVIRFDAETGSAVAFKVSFRDGKWSIPSHFDHPADGKDRLAKTAAGVIGVKKDDFRSDNVSDHEACGVVDPLDQATTSVTGRGERVTIKGDNDVVLADFILGSKIENREGFRFVRVPDQKRVYAARVDMDISTQFKDWIESDLLLVDKDAVVQIILKDYSINERTGQLDERDVLVLDKDGEVWKANRMKANQEVDATNVGQVLTTLDELAIEGVRPKPPGISTTLVRSSGALEIGRAEMVELQSKGYYFTRDGRLASNEGELQVRTRDAVTYTLRFGEIVYGSGVAVSAGASGQSQGGPGENRYLFITTSFDLKALPEPEKPKNTYFLNRPDSLWTDDDRRNKAFQDAHDTWEATQAERRKISDDLNARFANWYYVISAASFDKLHQTRSDLVTAKKTDS